MPELPEVETIVCGLREKLKDLEFSEVEVRLKKCVRGSPRSLPGSLRGKRILRVKRRGKNIIFHLSGGIALRVHLGMTGRLRFMPAPRLPEKHTHVIFSFKNHPGQLRFVDQRQFGRLFVEQRGAGDDLVSLIHLGPEPLEISAQEFIRRARAKHRAIKPLLLDQEFLAGVGNIYADEALHRAQIHPLRRTKALPKNTLLRLYDRLRRILRAAIRAGGTSVRTYVDASGSPGGFQRFLRVYGREGEACLGCGTPIIRERVAGRSSFFCPRCQPPPRRKRGRSASPRKTRSPIGKSVA